ncbi:DUF2125 domain-containing protein [Paracoccus sediminicola]|uniref:DUF2125 domain-containing protein n=1 Tax=Paracoccus sediminicola TaxID=3017783 RepID=UPI0022F0F8DF|nr:DUF2125 domain-containing protein [Paracoccus sediminicola]WBU58113.1 DUF2125 domain-containing protein [Paracoccus sediminicola]
MRKLVIAAVLLLILLAAGWYAGETWLSNRAREMVGGSGQITAAEVTPLRNPARVGLRLQDVDYGTAEAGFSAPDLEVYAPVSAPNTMTVDLPRQMQLRLGGAPIELTLEGGSARASISPTHEMTVRRAGVDARGLAVGGIEALQALDLDARLVHRGAAAPQGSAGAYAIDLSASGIALGALPERMEIAGPVQLWLSAVPGQAVLDGRAPPPAPTGIQTPGIEIAIGEMQARLIGRIEADENGYAMGEAAFYTDDARGFVEAGVAAGLIPQRGAMLANALIGNLAETGSPADQSSAGTVPETARDRAETAPPLSGEQAMDQVVALPPPAPGQIRLPLVLRDGEMRLGPVKLGPAPRMIR